MSPSSRLTRVGARVARDLSRAGFTIVSGAEAYSIQIQRPLYWHCQSQPHFADTNVCRGPMMQISQYLSTTTSNYTDGGSEEKETISVTFVDKDGEEKNIRVPVGMSMLEAAHENEIELEGACEGSLACSTCHVIVMDMEHYNKLEDPTDEENDMLDLAFGLTEMSRLGCQVIARPELDGIRLAIPSATRNFAVDGYVPKPH